MKKILIRCLLVASSSILALLLLEYGIRAFIFRLPDTDFIEPHPQLGWFHVPNKEGYCTVGKERVYVKMNSKGLRDREYPYEKDSGLFRILLLGDSFTEALQVPLEDTFAKLLESELNTRQRTFEVINAGFSGVGTDWELLFYRREGHKYHPDLVIVGFFQNDVYDNYRSKGILETRNSPLAFEKKGLVVRIKQFLAKRSSAYNYIGGILPKYAPRFASFLMKVGLLSFQPIDDAQRGVQLHWLVMAKEYPPQWRKAWEVTRLLFLELKKEVQGRGGNLAVVSIPFREQVYNGVWQVRLALPGMRSREWDLEKPDRILAQMLNEAEIPLRRLMPHFEKAAGNSLLYNKADGHLNAQGHKLAAELIHNWLVEERLVPVETMRSESSPVK